ncbi:MAG: peptidoglycan-binding domain-containing protein [Myxococcota bacterium]
MKPITLAAPKPLPPPPAPSPTPKPVANSSQKGFPAGDAVEIKKPSFTPAPNTTEVAAGKAQLKMGQQGPAVVELQKKLGVVATGRFDKNTEVAVAQLQKKQGLPTTGTVDAKTLAAIDGKGGAAPGPTATPKASGSEATADDLAAKMNAGEIDNAKAKATLDKTPGVINTKPSYPKALNEQIHLHNLEHLTKKLKAKEPLDAEEKRLAQGYLDFHAQDLSKPVPTGSELNQTYGAAYGQFVLAAEQAGMKAKAP